MSWKLTLVTCCVGASVAFYNMIAGTEKWGPTILTGAITFLVLTVLLVGPNIVLGALAISLRSRRVLSWILIAIALPVTALAAWALTVETGDYLQRDKSQPEGQRMGLFLIGLTHWFVATLTSASLLSISFYWNADRRETRSSAGVPEN